MRQKPVVSLSILGIAAAATVGLLAVGQVETEAHCQVPCGIYDDATRIKRLKEDAATIAKAIAAINELAEKRDANAFNQAARWVATKEDHASHIIEVVSEYFLAQKVKPLPPGSDEYDAYLKKLADHHAVMVSAMKTKQAAEPLTVTALEKAIAQLATHY
jgi:nickel superoxide dismutase